MCTGNPTPCMCDYVHDKTETEVWITYTYTEYMLKVTNCDGTQVGYIVDEPTYNSYNVNDCYP